MPTPIGCSTKASARCAAPTDPRTGRPCTTASPGWRLHSATRPQAWSHWLEATASPTPEPAEQVFEHFYFSLQAAVAGLGLAIAPWQLVRDDLQSGLLVAPWGFVPDGSAYYLLRRQTPEPDGAMTALLAWLRSAL